MQVQQKIMLELQDIPVSKLNELYDFIHYFKLGLMSEIYKQENEDFKIDAISCLSSLEKIENGDRSELIEMGNIDKYIENLRNEINKN